MSTTTVPQGRLMPHLVRWHLGLGELALRLFLLHLLWLLGTLAGGVVLGVLPATAAVFAVLREDRLVQAAEEVGEHRPSRGGLWAQFWTAWRAEFWRAHRLGGALALGWLVLALDRRVLTGTQFGDQLSAALGPLASGVVVVLTVVLMLLSAVMWPLAAHFSDPLPHLLRMGLVLLVRRPSITLAIALLLAAAIWLAQTMPGLVPVFGLALPAWAVTAVLWRSGAMPLSPPASGAPRG
ncbi:hypothetical protein CFK41_07820 [Brachybacterium ginsengisoli]|uniref:DUF624 domain-containing protein n=1 Tax=Brachybacterium ginsengisoli TaxID=1331682 RepID=A0A291GX62_9MICO|nr:DUF624 domain-containing protein [Brachybacterium ginsengisoli]ATG54684.1 hypothetical protein CFK41_07820 [Brachybacterium ginsengisoli]